MLSAVFIAKAMKPDEPMVSPGQVSLESMIPDSFSGWQVVASSITQVDLALRRDENDPNPFLYDQVLMRSYRNSAGDVVQLALAWGREQRQELKIHRPELCYVAQGFKLFDMKPVSLFGGRHLQGNSLLAVAGQRIEPVLYWIRIGDSISTSAWKTRGYILKEGLSGKIPDGILVRTSQIVSEKSAFQSSLALQERFLASLAQSLSPEARRVLLPDQQTTADQVASR